MLIDYARAVDMKRGFLVISGVAVLTFILLYPRFPGTAMTSGLDPIEQLDLVVREVPLSLRHNNRMSVDLPADRLAAALSKIVQHDFLRWSQLTHGLRLWGADADGLALGKWNGSRMLDIVCSAERAQEVFGFSPHILNRNGLHFGHLIVEDKLKGEKHLDETLSVFGEIGVHSDRKIVVWDQTTDVSSAVRAAATNLTLDQNLDFAPLAYALYLPPQSTWTNKFGEVITFDDVCLSVCEQPMGSGCCFGTHAIYSLACVLAANEQHKILSDTATQAVRSKLTEAVNALRESQQEDGCWHPEWFAAKRELGHADYGEMISATGHSLEWLAVAPQDIIDDPEMISRGCDGLLNLFLEAPSASLRDEYNYYTHAASALRMWSPESWDAAVAELPQLQTVHASSP